MDASNDQTVLPLDYPFKLLQFRLENRGRNVQRSALHIWLDRGRSIWFDWGKEAPEGYDIYVWFEGDFHEKYYQPLCAGKVPRTLEESLAEKAQKKYGPTKKKKKKKKKPEHGKTVANHQKRKMQVLPFEAALIQLSIYDYLNFDAVILTIVRYSSHMDGPLNMPIVVVRRLTEQMNISNCAHRDYAYINYQRLVSVFWSIVNNIKRKKIDFITGVVNPDTTWKLKPSVLDAHTYRNGMRDKNQK